MSKSAVLLIIFIILATLFLNLKLRKTTMPKNIINDNPGSSDYQKASLTDIENDKKKYEGVKVEITGVYEDMFESYNIDGRV